ncbi:MAG: hypothetical protein GY847_14720 [Proteobacteria bacterium]|nr:hypothetical protein [Pseudomonadota bacterium]
MTYNFDPERWFDNEMAILEAKKTKGEIDEKTFKESCDRLVDEYEKMTERLNVRHDYSTAQR